MNSLLEKNNGTVNKKKLYQEFCDKCINENGEIDYDFHNSYAFDPNNYVLKHLYTTDPNEYPICYLITTMGIFFQNIRRLIKKPNDNELINKVIVQFTYIIDNIMKDKKNKQIIRIFIIEIKFLFGQKIVENYDHGLYLITNENIDFAKNNGYHNMLMDWINTNENNPSLDDIKKFNEMIMIIVDPQSNNQSKIMTGGIPHPIPYDGEIITDEDEEKKSFWSNFLKHESIPGIISGEDKINLFNLIKKQSTSPAILEKLLALATKYDNINDKHKISNLTDAEMDTQLNSIKLFPKKFYQHLTVHLYNILFRSLDTEQFKINGIVNKNAYNQYMTNWFKKTNPVILDSYIFDVNNYIHTDVIKYMACDLNLIDETTVFLNIYCLMDRIFIHLALLTIREDVCLTYQKFIENFTTLINNYFITSFVINSDSYSLIAQLIMVFIAEINYLFFGQDVNCIGNILSNINGISTHEYYELLRFSTLPPYMISDIRYISPQIYEIMNNKPFDNAKIIIQIKDCKVNVSSVNNFLTKIKVACYNNWDNYANLFKLLAIE